MEKLMKVFESIGLVKYVSKTPCKVLWKDKLYEIYIIFQK